MPKLASHRDDRRVKRSIGWKSGFILLLLVVAVGPPSKLANSAPRDAATAPTPRPTPAAANWFRFRFDQRNHGYNPHETILNASNVGNLRQLWRIQVGSPVYSSAAQWRGTVYWAQFNTLYALRPDTGQVVWTAPLCCVNYSAVAVKDGVVYVSDNYVRAFDAITGAALWATPLAGSSPNVDGGKVFVGGLDHNVYALDASDGHILWSVLTGDEVDSSPAVYRGVVYVGSYDHQVYALDEQTGNVIWTASTGDLVYSSPAVAEGRVYVGSHDNYVYAFDAATGALKWKVLTGGDYGVWSSPSVAYGRVYVGATIPDSSLYALDPETGNTLWKFTTGSTVFGSPAIANGIVYIGSVDSNVYALDAYTGQLLWSASVGAFIHSSPAVVNGRVFVGAGDPDSSFWAFGL
jgi:eukaryotic-like serine/threonine-protein kinase